jgi:hypothetical protein
MSSRDLARRLLAQEARGLRTRLARLTPFALRVPMVAAAVSVRAQDAIERFLAVGRERLRRSVDRYLRWLQGPGREATPAEMQHRFTMVRLRFNVILEQFEIFSSALTQRSEHGTGVWLAGLDAVAADALQLEGRYYRAPPVICYLDRGIGAAIRRARTRLPGGDLNPVAIIRVPRERMVGSGIASSLIHEVGHQGAALLEVLPSLRAALRQSTPSEPSHRHAWSLWHRWISEIIADFWSLATLGIGATLGLMSVVSLPRFFVFRTSDDDPHPIPWIRVKLSCAMGRVLFPSPQWSELERLWNELYPSAWLDPLRRAELDALEETMPTFASLLAAHRPPATRGRALAEALPVAGRQPAHLTQLLRAWTERPSLMKAAAPSLVFAVLGQGRADGTVGPEEESRALAGLLTDWALRNALLTSAECAAPPRLGPTTTAHHGTRGGSSHVGQGTLA